MYSTLFLKNRLRSAATVLGLLCTVVAIVAAASGCALVESDEPTATPDYPVLETRVAGVLGATFTALAPTVTNTPTPTEVPPSATPTQTSTPTETPIPQPTAGSNWLSMMRLDETQAANVVSLNVDDGTQEILTRFAEPLNMSDVSWSKDGNWLVFVSAHDFLLSRNNERNIFVMRADGTELRMVTGEYVDPMEAMGPYATLKGEVIGSAGSCLVAAQGANPVALGMDGTFEIQGVSLSSTWVRAMCRDGDRVLHGDIDLVADEEGFPFVTIELADKGQGWNQASLSSEENGFAAALYRWEQNSTGERVYSYQADKVSWDGLLTTTLQVPEDAVLNSVEWSPDGDQIVGALTMADNSGTMLWLWDEDGESVGSLLELVNPDETNLSIANPAWSPDGKRIVFELRQWYWWGEHQYRTDLMTVALDAPTEPQYLIENEWGTHASNPTWSANGKSVIYQLTLQDPAIDYRDKSSGDIWSVSLSEPTPQVLTDDGVSYLPSVRPWD